MNHKALYAADGLLLSHGFCDFVLEDGQFVRDVPEDFDEQPRKVRWDGTSHEPAPEPAPRYLVDKLKVIDRLAAAGLFDAYVNTLPLLPLLMQERWRAAQSVYNDDPDVIAFLSAIGANPEVILSRDPD